MQIFIKTINASTILLNVEPSLTVSELKQLVSDREGLPMGNQRLRFGCKFLDNNEVALTDYDIDEMSTILLDVGKCV